jgi:hypothetical protein
MAQSRRISVTTSPQRQVSGGLKETPWATIVLLILALIVILGLWGRLPSRPHLPRQAPSGNAPGVSSLAIDNAAHS